MVPLFFLIPFGWILPSGHIWALNYIYDTWRYVWILFRLLLRVRADLICGKLSVEICRAVFTMQVFPNRYMQINLPVSSVFIFRDHFQRLLVWLLCFLSTLFRSWWLGTFGWLHIRRLVLIVFLSRRRRDHVRSCIQRITLLIILYWLRRYERHIVTFKSFFMEFLEAFVPDLSFSKETSGRGLRLFFRGLLFMHSWDKLFLLLWWLLWASVAKSSLSDKQGLGFGEHLVFIVFSL